MMQNSNELENKAKKIIEILTQEPKGICLAITGKWGVGKTYFWKNSIQNKVQEKTKNKVVYITLFGKEHYSQVLEEIVLQIYGEHNKIVDKIKNFCSSLIKLASNGVAIGLDSLFSIFEKEDFEKAIICFDDIERKSDKLNMKDFMGLLAHLKDIKECKVVIILDNEKIKQDDSHQKNNAGDSVKENNKDFSDFQLYKEKCIDYEFTINHTSQMARLILENEFKNIKKLKDKESLIEIGLKCCLDFDYNLRHLFKAIKNVKYFYEKCNFQQFYSVENSAVFYQIFKLIFEDFYLGEYNIDNPPRNIDEIPYSFCQSCIKYYIVNNYSLSKDNIEGLHSHFKAMLQDEYFFKLHATIRKFLMSNISDEEYIRLVEKNIKNVKNFMFGKNNIHYDFSYYGAIFRDYEKITGHKLEDEKRIRKIYIDFYITELNKNIYGRPLSTYELPNIKEIVESNESLKRELQSYYDKKIKENSNTIIFASWIQKWGYNIQNSFTTSYIGFYNNFNVDNIIDEFKTNEKFYEAFFKFFISISNAVVDKDNNLFKAFVRFLEEKEYATKKEKIRTYLQSHPNASLNKLFTNNE